MNLELEVSNAVARARLKLVTILNSIALTVGAVILSLHTMYPNAVSDFTSSLPAPYKLAALIIWSSIVQLVVHRTKKAL